MLKKCSKSRVKIWHGILYLDSLDHEAYDRRENVFSLFSQISPKTLQQPQKKAMVRDRSRVRGGVPLQNLV